MHDLVIRNGTVVDGTGAAAFVGDVAVAGGRIAAIGADVGTARETLDATGLLVTPGFVDIHTHYDAQVLWDDTLAPTVWHGVTTAIIGNCGVGFAPVRAADQEQLIDIMANVEDIPVPSLKAGLSWQWESYDDYLACVAATGRTMDIGSMITHSPLRIYVMGARALEHPTEAELARMCDLVREGMRAGAVGLSTSRTMLHVSSDGNPIPGTTAGEAELMALARAVREGGGGTRGLLEVSPAGIAVPEPVALRDEVDMMIRVAKASGCPVIYSLVQSNQQPQDYRDALDRTEAARAAGVPIKAVIATRPISTMLGFQGVYHPFAHLPSFAPLMGMTPADRLKALKDPALRARLLSEEVTPTGLAAVFAVEGFWSNVYIMGDRLNYYPVPGESIQDLADRTGADPKAIAYDAMMANEGRGFLMYVISNWGSRNRQPLREMVHSNATLVGLADGGAHITAIADSSQPTTFLADWVRDRGAADPLGIGLEAAIRKLTLDNAEQFCLADRGALRPGLRADINLIDLKALGVATPEMVFDMPTGQPRLDQRASGYVATLVNGQVTQRRGELTGARPGGLVRLN